MPAELLATPRVSGCPISLLGKGIAYHPLSSKDGIAGHGMMVGGSEGLSYILHSIFGALVPILSKAQCKSLACDLGV